MSEPIIQLKNISFTYHSTGKLTIKNMSFEIKKGQWVVIVGRNGSGKSTLSKLINGLLVPDPHQDSKIIVDGQELTDKNIWNIRDKVGIVFQNPDNQFVGATVADDVAFGLENRGVERKKMQEIVAKSLAAVDMQDFSNSEPSNLSGGQKQRVAVAGVLAVAPKIIILDEATSMLDPDGKNKILSIVRKLQQERDLTVISITHDVEEALLADQVLVINKGECLAQGKPSEIFSQRELLKKAGEELPFIYWLRDKLQENGIEISADNLSEKQMVKKICQLNSNM